jgi:hypothetical protein
VDAAYRSDLRELNELDFAQFDAKVDQRFAQSDAALERRVAERRAEIQVGLHSLEMKLIRWMFLFWIGQAATTVGMVFGLLKLTAR